MATSKKDASLASKQLRSPKSSAKEKSVAGSDLSQAKSLQPRKAPRRSKDRTKAPVVSADSQLPDFITAIQTSIFSCKSIASVRLHCGPTSAHFHNAFQQFPLHRQVALSLDLLGPKDGFSIQGLLKGAGETAANLNKACLLTSVVEAGISF